MMESNRGFKEEMFIFPLKGVVFFGLLAFPSLKEE